MAPHGRGRAGLGGLVGALLAVVAAVPTASAVTFGADLNRQPDGTQTCADLGSSSCTSTSIDLTTGESGFAPTGVGIVSNVSVRVGPVTGPMQIVELEGVSQYETIDPVGGRFSGAFVCCTAVRVTRTFTPQADGITTVPVHLPVRQDAAPDPGTNLGVSDFLALSVLAPDVPLPTGSAAGDSTSGSAWSPAWTGGERRLDAPAGTDGSVVLLSADWLPALPVELTRQSARVARGKATLRLACNLASGCRGQVALRRYGSASFSIGGGRRETLGVGLNRAGRKLLRGHDRATVSADFAVRGASSYPDHARVTLTR